MKEDANLICPVAYDDPFELWPKIQSDILDRLPLDSVQYKNPITATVTTIAKLPVRFTSSNSPNFKDNEHPYRWFLSAYCHVYILQAETADAYKAAKVNMKAWNESHNNFSGIKRSWLIVYVPSGKNTIEHYNKIFSKICQDFYVERPGDRSVQLNFSITQTKSSQIHDFLGRLKDLIVSSFQQRCALYDADLRKLESYRGQTVELKQVFLIKESLGLMYQMMQLPHEALIIYEDLESLVVSIGSRELQLGEYPWAMASSSTFNAVPTSIDASNLNATASTLTSAANGSTAGPGAPTMDGWASACRNGDEILLYSMNESRKLLLKNKLTLPELQKYIFSRQLYFLLEVLNNPIQALEKTIQFLNQAKLHIDKRISDLSAAASKTPVDGFTMKASKIGIIGMLSSDLSTATDEESIQSKYLQGDLFILVAAVKVARACKASIDQHLIQSTRGQSGGGGSIAASVGSNGDKLAFPVMTSPYLESGEQATNAILRVRDLLNLAFSKLAQLLPAMELSKSFSNNIDKLIGSLAIKGTRDDTDNWDSSAMQYLSSTVSRLGKAPRCDFLLQSMQLDEILSTISQRLRYLANILSTLAVKRKSLGDSRDKAQSIDTTSSSGSLPKDSESSVLSSSSSILSPPSGSIQKANIDVAHRTPSSTTSSHFGKILSLESSIPILFMRSLSAMDDLSGRFRMSLFKRLEYGLLMMYYCNYSTAILVLSSIISAFTTSSSSSSHPSVGFSPKNSAAHVITSLPLNGPSIPSLNMSYLQGSVLCDVIFHIVDNTWKINSSSSILSSSNSSNSEDCCTTSFMNFANVPMTSTSNLKVHLVTSTQLSFKRSMKFPFSVFHESLMSRQDSQKDDNATVWSPVCESILMNMVYCAQSIKDCTSYFILIIMLLRCRCAMGPETFLWGGAGGGKNNKRNIKHLLQDLNLLVQKNVSEVISEKSSEKYSEGGGGGVKSNRSGSRSRTSSLSNQVENNTGRVSEIQKDTISLLPVQNFQFPLSDFFVADICVSMADKKGHTNTNTNTSTSTSTNASNFTKQSDCKYPIKSSSASSLASNSPRGGAFLSEGNYVFATIYSCLIGNVNSIILRLFSKVDVDITVQSIRLNLSHVSILFNESSSTEDIVLEGAPVELSKVKESSNSAEGRAEGKESEPTAPRYSFRGVFAPQSSTGIIIKPGGNIIEFALPFALIGDYVVTSLSISLGSLVGCSPIININSTQSSGSSSTLNSSSSSSSAASDGNPFSPSQSNSVNSVKAKAVVSFVHNFPFLPQASTVVENPIQIIRISEISANESNSSISHSSNSSSGNVVENSYISPAKMKKMIENSRVVNDSIVPRPQLSDASKVNEGDVISSNSSSDIGKSINVRLYSPPCVPTGIVSSYVVLMISIDPILFPQIRDDDDSVSYTVIKDLVIDLLSTAATGGSKAAESESAFGRSTATITNTATTEKVIKLVSPAFRPWSSKVVLKSSAAAVEGVGRAGETVTTACSVQLLSNNSSAVSKADPEYLHDFSISISDVAIPKSMKSAKVGIEIYVEVPIVVDGSKDSTSTNSSTNSNNNSTLVISANCTFLLSVGYYNSLKLFFPVKGMSSVVVKQTISLLRLQRILLSSSNNDPGNSSNTNQVSLSLKYKLTNCSAVSIIMQAYSFMIPSNLRDRVIITASPLALKCLTQFCNSNISADRTESHDFQALLQKALVSTESSAESSSANHRSFNISPKESYYITITVKVLDLLTLSLSLKDVVKSLKLTLFYGLSSELFHHLNCNVSSISYFASIINHIYSAPFVGSDVIENIVTDDTHSIEFDSSSDVEEIETNGANINLSFNTFTSSIYSSPISLESLFNFDYLLYVKPSLPVGALSSRTLDNYRYSLEMTVHINNLDSWVPIGYCKKRYLFNFAYSSFEKLNNNRKSGDKPDNIIRIPQFDSSAPLLDVLLPNEVSKDGGIVVFEIPFNISAIPTTIGDLSMPDLSVSYEIRRFNTDKSKSKATLFEARRGNLNVKVENYNYVKKESCRSTVTVIPTNRGSESASSSISSSDDSSRTLIISSFRAIKFE